MKGGKSIQRKIVVAIMTTTLVVIGLMSLAFATYDLVTFRRALILNLNTLSRVVAENSTAALAFENETDAREVLSALKADPHIISAALFKADGTLFATYPTNATKLPVTLPRMGYYAHTSHVEVFTPVTLHQRLGTLYIKSDLKAFYSRFQVYGGTAFLVMAVSLAVAYVLSGALQRRVSQPILALAQSARMISEEHDYSVRAPKQTDDELGVLTDAFNQMLTRIQEQTDALQGSEERLRLALQAAAIGTWDWNIEKNVTTWDAQNYALFGRTPLEFGVSYDSFVRSIHPDDRTSVQSAIATALKEKKDFMSEFRVVLSDGTIRHLLARGKAIYNSAGEPVRMTGVTADMTERKSAEETRAFLAAIVTSSQDAIISKDLNSLIISWNHGAERLFGYRAGEVIGKPITLIIPAERITEESIIMDRLRHGEAMEHYETIRIRKDGTPLNVSITVSPIRDDQGKVIGASNVSRDITDRVQAETALRESETRKTAILESALDAIITMDQEGRIVDFNPAAERLFRFNRNEVVGKTVAETIIPERFREAHWHGLKRFLHNKESSVLGRRIELSALRSDGSEFAAELAISAARLENGEAFFTAYLRDITERKMAEEEIQKLNDQLAARALELETRVRQRTAELEDANKEMEAFTYSVAHDLRAPLRHMDAYAKLLTDEFSTGLPEEARHYLENMRRGSRNMGQLVDDLLNLARIGRQSLKQQPVPIRDVVDTVIMEIQRDTSERKIEWRIGELPVLECDPGLMKQVFINLLSNAVKYTRRRELAIIEIGSEKSNGKLVFFVRDNGVGFNMKYADKLFGVFQRLHRAEEFEGTGVGLAIVERIIRRHGGKIWADAAVDRGATFYISLPARAGQFPT